MQMYASRNTHLYIYIFTRSYTYILLHLPKVEVHSFRMPNMQIAVRLWREARAEDTPSCF